MRIPKEPVDRQQFYMDLIDKCMVSQSERMSVYAMLRSYYLFGSGMDESPAHFNKIFPHIDQLSSFMYSAETTRFSIQIGASEPTSYHKMIPAMTKALHDYWINSNADQVFAQSLNWSLCYNSTFSNWSGATASTRTWWTLVYLASYVKTRLTRIAKRRWPRNTT